MLAHAAVVLLLQVPTLLPLQAGTWWEYREVSRTRIGELWSASEDVTRFVVRGSSPHLFLLQEGGADPSPGPVEWGEGWIRLTPWTGEEPLPLPLIVGAKGPGQEENLAGWVVEAEEAVAVPAGEFRALRCALRTPDLESVLWIAPQVGVIRETQGAPGLPPELERELVRWSGGLVRGSVSGEAARVAPAPRRPSPRSTRPRPDTQ